MVPRDFSSLFFDRGFFVFMVLILDVHITRCAYHYLDIHLIKSGVKYLLPLKTFAV